MTTESNKLIMKFMDERVDPYTLCDMCGKEDPECFPNTRLTKCCSTRKVNGVWDDPSKFCYTVDENTSSIGKATKCTPKVLEYDKDWNLLMGVVEKLNVRFILTHLLCTIGRQITGIETSTIDMVYQAVLKHIQYELSNDQYFKFFDKMKQINLTTEQAKQIFQTNPELRTTVLVEFTDEELGIEPLLPKTWESLDQISGYWITEDASLQWADRVFPSNACSQMIYSNDKQAKSALAFAQLSQLAKAMNGDWESDWKNTDEDKYTIQSRCDSSFLLSIDCRNVTMSHITFKTEELAEFSLKHHRELWEDYWMI